MPTLRCPGCQRALNLPEHQVGATARCPLCRTTFPTARAEPPRPPAPASTSVPQPQRPGMPRGVDVPFPIEGDARPLLPQEDRQRLESAALLLKWMAWLGFVQGGLSLCCCTSFPAAPPQFFAWMYFTCLQIGAMFLVYAGADAMMNQQRHRLASVACVVAIGVGVVLLMTGGVFLLSRRGLYSIARVGDLDLPVCLWSVLPVVVAILGLLGGTQGWTALSQPGVREAFRR